MSGRVSRVGVLLVVLAAACSAPVRRAPEPPAPSKKAEAAPPPSPIVKGLASFYGPRFHGRLTANGERFDMHAMTAAHRTLPFNTCLHVVNERNGRSVRVRINDRGPYAGKQVLDVSAGAASVLGMVDEGLAPVRAWRCPEGEKPRSARTVKKTKR